MLLDHASELGDQDQRSELRRRLYSPVDGDSTEEGDKLGGERIEGEHRKADAIQVSVFQEAGISSVEYFESTFEGDEEAIAKYI